MAFKYTVKLSKFTPEKPSRSAFLVALIPALPIPEQFKCNDIVSGCAVIAANDEDGNEIYSYVHLEDGEKQYIGDAMSNACVPMNEWTWCQLFISKE